MKENEKYTMDACDELMLDRLFAEAASTEVADGGFTDRVMLRLPSASAWRMRLWTCLCGGAGLVLAVVFRAWEYVVDLLAWWMVLMQNGLFGRLLLWAPLVMVAATVGVMVFCLYLAVGELRGRTDPLAF